jgi:hypothetical protein
MKGDSYAPGESPIYVTPIESTMTTERQGIKVICLYNVSNFKVKLAIYLDHYDFQSYAKAYVWSQNDLTWNFVYEIPYSLMKTKRDLTPNREDSVSFGSDEATLLSGVKKILF